MCIRDSTLAARYAEVSSTESYPLNFFARKDEVEHDLDFKCEGYRSYNMPFTMRVLQSTVHAASDTVVGLDDIPYSIIYQLLDVAMATLLALCNLYECKGSIQNHERR